MRSLRCWSKKMWRVHPVAVQSEDSLLIPDDSALHLHVYKLWLHLLCSVPHYTKWHVFQVEHFFFFFSKARRAVVRLIWVVKWGSVIRKKSKPAFVLVKEISSLFSLRLIQNFMLIVPNSTSILKEIWFIHYRPVIHY